MVAVVLRVDDAPPGQRKILTARIAVGSCSAVAQRLRKLEQDLVGCPVEELGALVEPAHLASLSPIDDVRATAEYRLDASLTLVERALNACAAAVNLGSEMR